MSESGGCSERPRLLSAGELSVTSSSLAVLLDGTLAKGASLRFRAHGTSMSPFIRHGDVVTIASVDASEADVGDVVAYVPSNGSRLIVHRIVGAPPGAFLIAGDGSSDAAVEVRPQEIAGRVVKIERGDREIRIGLGMERRWIALLTRTRLLQSFVLPVLRRVRSLWRWKRR